MTRRSLVHRRVDEERRTRNKAAGRSHPSSGPCNSLGVVERLVLPRLRHVVLNDDGDAAALHDVVEVLPPAAARGRKAEPEGEAKGIEGGGGGGGRGRGSVSFLPLVTNESPKAPEQHS